MGKMKTIKNYATAVARIPQYVISRILYVSGWSLIAMGNVINGNLEQVHSLHQKTGTPCADAQGTGAAGQNK